MATSFRRNKILSRNSEEDHGRNISFCEISSFFQLYPWGQIHQSTERISAKLGIKPATSCSQVLYATDLAMGQGPSLTHYHTMPHFDA